MSRKKYRISTDDYCRVILTETIPYEVPLIFSNTGIYDFYKNANTLNIPDVLRYTFGLHDSVSQKKPFKYRISKDINSTRELSLIHPAVQFCFVNFYKDYDSLLLYNCSKSEFSLRYPKKIASAVYRSKNDEAHNILSSDIKPVKAGSIDLDGEDKRNKYSSNYFSYRKFDVLYKFFESSEFIRLEKRFNLLTCLDVSRCFDTIYTHSLSWAVKSKDFIKESLANKVREPNSFDDIFDVTIRKANDNETNGIVIGPEFSRIFSEIIFQSIDQDIFQALSHKDLIHNRDYAIRRYIDDIYIFSKSNDTQQIIIEEVVDSLWDYKFRINPSKQRKYKRPFTTERSRNIIELRSKIHQYFDDLVLKKENAEGKRFHAPKEIKDPVRASTAFIKEVKSMWSSETHFSNYILSAIRTVYVEIVRRHVHSDNSIDGNSMVNFSIFLIEICHYCFALSPRVSESYKLCHLIIIMTRFIKRNFEDYLDKINHKTHDCLLTLLNNELSGKSVCGVERLNVILTLSEIDRYYLPESKNISKFIFDDNDTVNYFNVIVGLYIAKDDPEYSSVRDKSLAYGLQILNKGNGIFSCSESLHLYLDLLSCPYVTEEEKKMIVEESLVKMKEDPYIKNKPGSARIPALKNEILEFCSNRIWFVDWKRIDLLLALQRKLLKESY
ncbi:MAG: antiviral reverse transcriptase Drt3b [Candidatus Sedimenticola sp. PURPLELP]